MNDEFRPPALHHSSFILYDVVRAGPMPLREFESLGLLEARTGRYVPTRRGKLMADSVAEAFI